MKIIHLADIHLGASNRKLSSSLQRELKNQNASRLKYVFDYAKKNDIDAIIISGDLFHSKNPSSGLVKFFVDILSSCQIPVFYVKGNHDEDFIFSDNTFPKVFHVFDENFSSFSLGQNLSISGKSGSNLDFPVLDNSQFNIVLLHGDIHSKGNDYIDLKLCKNKNINYLALGHIHTFEEGKIDEKGKYCYSGCLTGNGFDECGDKGFVVFDTDKYQITFKVIDGSRFLIKTLDISGFTSFDNLCDKIDKVLRDVAYQDFLRLELVGWYQEDQDKFLGMIENKYSSLYSYFELVDKSKIKIDTNKLKQEKLSFKAEFLRLVSQDDSLSEEDKNKICEFGITALRGDDLWNWLNVILMLLANSKILIMILTKR